VKSVGVRHDVRRAGVNNIAMNSPDHLPVVISDHIVLVIDMGTRNVLLLNLMSLHMMSLDMMLLSVLLNLVLLNVMLLSVVPLSVVPLSVVLLNVMLLSVVPLAVAMLGMRWRSHQETYCSAENCQKSNSKRGRSHVKFFPPIKLSQ